MAVLAARLTIKSCNKILLKHFRARSSEIDRGTRLLLLHALVKRVIRRKLFILFIHLPAEEPFVGRYFPLEKCHSRLTVE